MAVGGEPSVHHRNCFGYCALAVHCNRIVRRVDVHAFTNECFGPNGALVGWHQLMFREPFGSWHLNCDNWQLVFASKVEVALIATWHCHDCAGSVAHQDVVGNPHRYFAARYGVDCKCSREHACFLARVVLAVDVLQRCGCFAVSLHRVALVLGSQRVNERMLWREHHEGCTEQCVGTGSEHFDRASSRCKLHARTGGSANPIALHQFERVCPVQSV